MVEYIGKNMIVDTRAADGGVYFEKERFIWKSRNYNPKLDIIIYYKDIKDVVIISGIKKRVDVTLNDGKMYNFFLYRSGTFVELINAGREACKDQIEEKGSLEMSDEDIEKLKKLSELQKGGVLTTEQFEAQKNEILKKYNL